MTNWKLLYVVILFFYWGSQKGSEHSVLRSPLISVLEVQTAQFPFGPFSSDHHAHKDHFSDGNQGKNIPALLLPLAGLRIHTGCFRENRLFLWPQSQRSHVWKRSPHLLLPEVEAWYQSGVIQDNNRENKQTNKTKKLRGTWQVWHTEPVKR